MLRRLRGQCGIYGIIRDLISHLANRVFECEVCEGRS